jgi:HK97 gp10 family phage protein
MKIRGRVEGLASLRSGLARIADRAALAEMLTAGAEDIRAAARVNLQDGQPPQSRRGDLADSLVITPAADGLSVTVGTTVAHGWRREFGTLARPAAPWLEPALETARPGVLARLRQQLAASAKR